MVTMWDEPTAVSNDRASKLVDQVEAETANLERLLRLSRENGFDDLIVSLTQEITDMFVPGLTAMLCLVDGEDRKRMAVALRRLRECIG